MELELGLKVTRTREDVSSSVDFRFSKDPFGPLVLSQETDSRFIIIIHLKGFKKEGIEIEINKEGDKITISGRKPVEEMLMIRWMAWRKEVEMRAFRKVFLIPDVVDLDKIKARFDDDDATLTITMPKRVKGISGFNLEQEEEEEEESVEFGDVSEVENREEVEEEDEERDESDEHSEIQGEMMKDKEREGQVSEGEEEGFNGAVDEEEAQVEDDDLEKIEQTDEQDKVLEFAEGETVDQQELADSDIESEDSGLEKLPDIKEQEDKEEVMEHKVSEEIKSEDIGSGAVQETEEQESDEDSGLKNLQDIIEQEDKEEVMEEKVSEEKKSDDLKSEATEEIEEQESDVESGLEELPDIMEQEDNQEVTEQKVSKETKSDDNGSGAVKEIEEQESDEDSDLKRVPDTMEQEDNQEVTEQKVSEETKSDGIGSGAVQEIEEQESDEVVGTSKSREMENKKTDGDDGLRKAQGIEEPERHNEERKIQEMVEEETSGQEKDAKEESDGKETQNEDEELEKSQRLDEEERVGQHEFADPNTESEDRRKPLDSLEQDVKKQKDSQAKTRSDGFGSRAFEEIQKQEPHEELDGTSKVRATADDDGLRKAQGIREPERSNEVKKNQEKVEGETSDPEKRKNVKMDPKEDVDGKMGEGSTPNTERSQVVAEDDAETKAEELEYGKPDKKHELVEKKEEEDTKVRRQSEDSRSLIKLQENEERHSKERENIKELEEEKTQEAEKNTGNGVRRPVQETEPEVMEKKVSEETKSDNIGSGAVDEMEEKIAGGQEKNAKEESKGKETQTEDEDLEKSQQIDEIGNEEKNVGEQEYADSVTESGESSSLRKPPDILEQEKNKDMMDQKDSGEESRSDDFGSGAFEEIEKQEPCEKLDATSESREMADGDGLSKVQGIGEPERRNEVSKIQEMVEGGTSDPEKRKTVKMEITSRDPKEDVDEGFTPNIERTGVVAETETKAEELGSIKPEADKVDKKHELVEKKEAEEEENTKVRMKSEDRRSLTKFQENEEQHSKGTKRQDKQESIKELVKENAPVAETSIGNDVQKELQETEASEVDTVAKTDDEGKAKMETAPNTAETETKPEDNESEKLGSDEVDNRHKLVEKKVEEDDDVKRKSEDRSLIKLQENDEQHSKARKGQEKQETIKELVEEKTPEAERSMANDVPKPVQEIKVPKIAVDETKPEEFESDKVEPDEVEKIHKLVEKKEEEDEKNAEAGTQSEDIISSIEPQEAGELLSQGQKRHEKIKELVEEETAEAETNIENDTPKPVQEETNDAESRKVQETIRRQELDECERREKESKTQELVKSNEEKEEKETEETVTKEQVSYKPKVLGGEEEEEKVQELAEEKLHFPKNGEVKEEEKVPEKKTGLGDDDDISRKDGDLDAKEEVDAEMGKVASPRIAETETKPEDIESEKLAADEVEKVHKMAEKKEEEDTIVRQKGDDSSLVKLLENEEPHSEGRKQQDKQESIKETVEEKAAEAETIIANDVLKPVQDNEPEVGTLGETCDEGNEEQEEKKKSVGLEVKSSDAKEEVDAKLSIPNIAETETRPKEFESEQVEANEVHKIHELVEKNEEEEETDAKAGTESEDISLIKPQEAGEQLSQGQKQHHKQEKIEELVEEQTPQADVNIRDDTLKPVLERCEEGKQKIPKLIQEERKKQPKEHKEKMAETGNKIDDAGSRKVQDTIRQEDLDEAERCEKESETLEAEEKEEEKGIEQTAEKKTEFCYDDPQISRRVGDTEERDTDSEEEVDPEIGKGITPNTAETETKGEEYESQKLEPDENDDTHKVVEEEENNAKVRKQSEDRSLTKLPEKEEQNSKRQKRQVKTAETETNIPTPVGDTGQRDSDAKEEFDPEMIKGSTPNISETEKKADTVKAVEEDRIHELVEKKKKKEENDKVRKQSEDTGLKRLQEEKFQGQNKQEKTKELVEGKPVQETERPDVSTLETCEDKVFAETETKDQESYRPKILQGEDTIQELADEKMNLSRKVEDEEETAENSTELSDDDLSRKAPDIEQRGSDAIKVKAENDKSRKVQEIDEHEEEDEVQKTIGGETSGQGEFQDVESEKKKREADKRFSDSAREAKEYTFQEEADRPERGKGWIQQELVNLNSQMEQQNGEKTQELVDEKINKEEESETKTDEDLMEDKIAEPEIEAEHGDLSTVHGSEEQESHEPTIRRERFKTGTEEPSGQEKEEKEKVVEYMRITDKENSPNAKGIKNQRPDKESHEKQYNIQDLVEAGHNETEEDTSKKVHEIESDGLKRSVVQDKKRETEEKDMSRAMEEKEIEERRTKTEDGSLRKVQHDEDPEMIKPYNRQEEDKIQEPVEMGTSGYKENIKNDISRRQEPGKPNLDEVERRSEQKHIPQGEDKVQKPVEMRTRDYREKVKKQDGDVEEEKVENMADLEGKVEDDSSDKFHEIEERKPYEDWTHEGQEKRKDFGKEEATDPKESEEQAKARAVEEKRTKTEDVSLRKVQDDEDPGLSQPYKPQEENKVHESVETGTSDYREDVKKQDGDDTLRNEGPKDKHTAEADHYDHKEEQEEEKVIAKRELKAEEDTTGKIQETEKQKPDKLQRSLVQDKLQETEEKEETRAMEENETVERRTKTEDGSLSEVGGGKETASSKPYKRRDKDKIQKLEEMETSDDRENVKKQDGDDVLRSQETGEMDSLEEEETGPKDEHTGGKEKPKEEERYEKVAQTETKVEDEINKEVEDSLEEPLTKTQEIEKEESHEPEIHEKLEIVQDFVEEETRDQEDEVAEEAAAVHANYDEDSSRIMQTIKEHEEGKERRNDPGVEGEAEERIAEKETKEKEAHVQEAEGKTEDFKDYDGESRRGGKTFETESDYDIVRKVRDTKLQDSNEKKDQEPEEKIDELERKETSSHEVKLVTEEDSLTKGQEFLEKESSKRQPVGQENIQQLMDVEKREDEEESDAGVEIQARIKEEKGIGGNEKVAEVEMQANIGIRMKEKETKRQEQYELLENEEHDKIQEPVVQGTKYQREEEKRVEDREDEEMKRKPDDVISKKVQKIKEDETDGLEKPMELSEIQENQPVEEEEEMNEAGGYKAVLKKTKFVEDSRQSQDVEEKGSYQTEQDKIKELIAEEDEEEQNEKAQRIPQVESKANDDNSKKNETGILRGEKQKEDHQEVVETEASDQRKEEREEKIVGKAVTRDECDSSRKNQEHEEELSDKLGRHGEEEMSRSFSKEETSNDKEENRGNRAGAETTIKDDKKQLLVEKDTSGEAKENRNQETKSRDDSSRENEKQESHELKRNYEEQEPERLRKQEDGSSKKIQEIDKEGSSEPRKDVEREKIQPVDNETSEDESEELEVEVEDSEEDWEAEVIQEKVSDEYDSDKLRKIRRFKLGFRLVGGSTLFMSLIVIVFRLIRSKRKIKCYKF